MSRKKKQMKRHLARNLGARHTMVPAEPALTTVRATPEPVVRPASHDPRSRVSSRDDDWDDWSGWERKQEQVPGFRSWSYHKPVDTCFDRKLTLHPRAWLKWQFLCHNGSTEAGGWGVSVEGYPLYIYDIVVPGQLVTPAAVEFTEQGMIDLSDEMSELKIPPDRWQRVWFHTHPGESPSPSGTDEATFSDPVFTAPHWVVMAITGQTGKTYARLKVNVGPKVAIEIPVVVDWSPWAAYARDRLGDEIGVWAAEYAEKVVTRAYGVGFGSYTYTPRKYETPANPAAVNTGVPPTDPRYIGPSVNPTPAPYGLSRIPPTITQPEGHTLPPEIADFRRDYRLRGMPGQPAASSEIEKKLAEVGIHCVPVSPAPSLGWESAGTPVSVPSGTAASFTSSAASAAEAHSLVQETDHADVASRPSFDGVVSLTAAPVSDLSGAPGDDVAWSNYD